MKCSGINYALSIIKAFQSSSLIGEDMDLVLPSVMTQQHWSLGSSWPALSESDEGTAPSACSHTACRTSWCRKDCSPGREEKQASSVSAFYIYYATGTSFAHDRLYCIN